MPLPTAAQSRGDWMTSIHKRLNEIESQLDAIVARLGAVEAQAEPRPTEVVPGWVRRMQRRGRWEEGE